MVGSLAEAASAACDRVLRGLPASSTMRELIARALGSRRRVGGRCEAAVMGAARRLLYRGNGAPPARAASHARPVVWQTPPCQELLAGARAGRLAL